MYQIYFISEWDSTSFGGSLRPSSGVRDCTYSNRHLSNRYCCLLASGYPLAVAVWQMPVAVCTGLFEMIVGVLTTCHTQYTWDRSTCIFFYLIEQHSKFLLHTLQVLYMCTLCDSTNINTHPNIPDSHFELPCTVLNSWWWTEGPSETCRVSFQNKVK